MKILIEMFAPQRDDLISAASATYTALLGNPDDEMMRKNLQFYLDKLGEEHSSGFKISDLEQKVYRTVSRLYLV